MALYPTKVAIIIYKIHNNNIIFKSPFLKIRYYFFGELKIRNYEIREREGG